MLTKPILAAAMAVFVLGGCRMHLPDDLEPVKVSSRDKAPPGAEPGTCWDRDDTPAVVETVTEQVVLAPARLNEDGTVAKPAAYKTETRQKIVKPRQETWFETPCPDAFTPEFTASLQRALKARGHYRGPVTGEMNRATLIAVRAYQKPQGLDSATLSLAAARQMGLAEVALPGRAPEKEATGSDPAEAQLAGTDTEANDHTGTLEAAAEATGATAAEDAAARKAAEARAAEAARARAEARLAAKRAAEQEALAEAQALYRAEEARRAEQLRAEQEAREAEAARQEEEARKAEEARKTAKARAEKAAAEQALKAKRARELQQALEAERAANRGKPRALPISSESY